MNFIWSEEEFDWVLREHAQQLVVLEASLTWCRPCKGFERAFQVQECFNLPWKTSPPTVNHGTSKAAFAVQSCWLRLRGEHLHG